MRSKWSLTSIGEFCPFIYGKGLSESKRIPGNIKVYGSNGVVGTHSEALVNKPGIIIGRKGTVGAVHYSKNPFWPIDTTFYVTEAPHRDLRFTYYLLKYINLKHMNSDSAVPGLNRDSAHSRKIFIPELSEQMEIANILESLDKKIDLLGKSNKTLESIAQTIFKSWFVDFDPVRAKSEGRAAEGIDAETATLFPDSFEESELGLVPKSWKVGILGDICSAKGGFAYKSNAFSKYGSPVVKIKNIVGDGTVNLQDCVCINDELSDRTSKFSLDDGDIVIAMTGATIGKTGIIVTDNDKIPFLNQRVAKFEAKSSKNKDCWFVYTAFQKGTIFDQVINIASGSAQPNISTNGIESSHLIIPNNYELIDIFNETVSPLFLKWIYNQKQVKTLIHLRDTLLPRLISGQLQLPDEVIKEDAK